MIRNAFLFLALISMLAFVGCSKEPDCGLKYLATDNPLDSIHYFYSRAETLLEGDAALYNITGVRRSMEAGTEFDIKWDLYFFRDEESVIFTVSKGYVSEKTISGTPIGSEYVNESDSRLLAILPPVDVWTKCISENGKPLLSFSLYVPLIYPPVETFRYVFYTKEGYCYPGIEVFVYDAGTGENITSVKGVAPDSGTWLYSGPVRL